MPAPPTTPLSRATLDLRLPMQTMPHKVPFWLSYLREVLPPPYKIVYIDEKGHTQFQAPPIGKGIQYVRIHIQLNEQTVMRGIIHTVAAKQDAWKAVMVEQAIDTRVPEIKDFFTANDRLCFHVWDGGEAGWESYRRPAKTFDPVRDLDGVRGYFAKVLGEVKGMEGMKVGEEKVKMMSKEEYEAWEREMGIDDESMKEKDRHRVVESGFLGFECWSQGWFLEDSFDEVANGDV